MLVSVRQHSLLSIWKRTEVTEFSKGIWKTGTKRLYKMTQQTIKEASGVESKYTPGPHFLIS